jgi:hypothetical protein
LGSTLWENLRDEIQDPDTLQPSSEDDEINETSLYPHPERFLVGHGMVTKDLTSLHPQPVHIFKLWQTFLVNVNPLVKLFHAPTVQQTILDASGDLQHVSKPVEALMFSIYLLAVTSLQGDDCERMFGESRSNLLSKYSHGTQEALINAKFMKSLNLTTLNAYCLYLLAVRKFYDPHSFWILTGTGCRIAQRLGIHKDIGHKFTPFEDEMRRRTWWNVAFLDGQASKLAGAGFPEHLIKSTVRLPTNISDSDLTPSMKELPAEKEGVTEMMFCSLRYDVARAMRDSTRFTEKEGGGFWQIGSSPDLIAEKDKTIDELEARFMEKYIRYCDPSIPLHLLTIFVTKSIICTMRLMAHHPRQYPDKGASMPQSEKDMLLEQSLKELEVSSFGHTEKAVKGFLWHIHVHFQLDAFIYVLSELRHRTSGEQVERAWKLVEIAYEQRPEMLTEVKNSLYFAIGGLALKAWAKREEAGVLYSSAELVPPPRFISVLRTQRRIPEPVPPPVNEFRPVEQYPKPMLADANSGIYSGGTYQAFTGDSQWNYSDGMDMTMPDIGATEWEYYQTLLEGELPAYIGQDSGWNGPVDTKDSWIV